MTANHNYEKTTILNQNVGLVTKADVKPLKELKFNAKTARDK